MDFVWHFASPASPIDYLELPIQALKVGSLGTHKAFGLAMHKKARFRLASTSEIYGDPLVHPQTEEYWGNVNTIGPRGCYDESKRFAEALTVAYHREHKVDTRIVRIFNTYGPRMRLNDGRVVPAFVSQALKNKPITVFGKGQQTRSFCYCSDLIEGIYRLMMSNTNDPVNIGNPQELTIRQFAQEIIKATSSRSRVVYKPLPQDAPPPAPAGHHASLEHSKMGASRFPWRRPGKNHRILPRKGLMLYVPISRIMREISAAFNAGIRNAGWHCVIFCYLCL